MLLVSKKVPEILVLFLNIIDDHDRECGTGLIKATKKKDDEPTHQHIHEYLSFKKKIGS